MSDIGTLFPDTDNKFKDADSIELLKCVFHKVQEQGYYINNLDANIIAQAPKMMPHIPNIKIVLAKNLNMELEDISIKAKTKENLDAIGEKLAIEAQAVVMLEKLN